MRVAVIGASGFLGRPVTRAFVRAGHQVRGVVRSPQRTPMVLEDGGQPIVGDILDVASLRPAIEGCDRVVHLASAPGGLDLDEMRRVRVGGSANLVTVAKACGVSRVIIGSGYWVYADARGTIDETSPLNPLSIS